MSGLLTNAEFCVRRDYFRWQRRVKVLPQLKARENALNHEIEVLRMFLEWMGELPYKGLPWEEFQKNLSHNHQREKLLSAIVDIQREYQDVYAQISVIESEHEALTARVPEEWIGNKPEVHFNKTSEGSEDN